MAVAGAAVIGAAPDALAATANGGPGTPSTWNATGGIQGVATSLGQNSKVWYTLGNGALENVFYPQTDNPDTYGLQYYVTDGSSFTDNEISNTTHAVTLADPHSLTWEQTNTAKNGKYTITKTYVADPARSVVLVQTTFQNLSSTPLYLYADYDPQLNNQGMGNNGSTDSSGDLVAVNGPVSSAMAASTGFSSASTGYIGTSSSGATQLVNNRSLTSIYSGTSSSGHIDQVGQIPVASSGSTTFTLALGFDTSESAAVSDVSASLASGFSTVEASYEAGWHTWMDGLNAAPASVSTPALSAQYYIALMETKADEDKNYPGAFVASLSTPWGQSVSADGQGQHGYHLVWTRDEYQMATSLLAAGDTADANDALDYLFRYEMESSGQVKQNTWLNGNQMWGGNQMDEEADPIILAYQLGRTSASDFANVKLLANWIASRGPYTGQERWEEQSGYSPATIAAEIAGLVAAAKIATINGDSGDASSWLSTATNWASNVDNWTYTTTGSYGNGSYFLRITPDQQPNSGAYIGLANGGGSHDDRTVVDQSFLDLVRLGVKSASATDITNTLAVTDAQLGVNTSEGLIDHRYNFDGYGETASGADYTGAGVGQPWPVLTGERGEYEVAAGNLAAAQAALQTMQGAATTGGQISEQVWGASTGTNGFAFGQADNSASPLMWAMAQFVRLAVDISAGTDVDTPAVVCQQFNTCVTTIPPAKPGSPAGLSTTSTTTTTASLSWTAPAVNSGAGAASSYQILRAPVTGGVVGTYVQVGTTSTTTFTDTGLTASTTYAYEVTASNQSGVSAASQSVQATTIAPGVPPNAPTGVTVNATAASTASLSWTASTDSTGTVAGYYVLRDGTVVGTVTGTSYTDTGLAPNTTYSYTVEGFDTDGNVSAASSPAASATTLNGPVGNQQVVNVTVPANTDASGLVVYLAGSLSALGNGQADWAADGIAMTRVDATHWTTMLHATSPATLQYKYTLGGVWANNEETASCGYVANRSLTISAATTSDTVANWAGPATCGTVTVSPPNAPASVAVTGTTTSTASLSWTASTDTTGTVAGYHVLRNGTVVGSTGNTSYTDTGLSASTSYTYTVEAYDTVGNVSAASAGVTATTATPPSSYTETLNVTVPVNTDASGATVYLAGTLSALGNGQADWAANGIALTRVDATHWKTTINATSSATLAYKFTLGGSWSDDEVTASCGNVANRSLTVNNTTANVTVANWAGPATCGSAQAVINVTVPSSTPSNAVVYLSGNFSTLGTGMSSANDWVANEIPMTKTGTNTWTLNVSAVSGTTLQYKFDLGTWDNTEETSSCGALANRTFYFNGSGSSYTANNTVTAWKGYGC